MQDLGNIIGQGTEDKEEEGWGRREEKGRQNEGGGKREEGEKESRKDTERSKRGKKEGTEVSK